MMKILAVYASIQNPQSHSRRLAHSLIEHLLKKHPGSVVKTRDLVVDPPEHWGLLQVQSSFTEEKMRSEEQKNALLKSDFFCDEILRCDELVIASPMWNFSIPSVLKAWIDHIVRLNVTFKYGEAGPVGMAHNIEKVYIVESAGGFYVGDRSHLNHVAPYLESIFKFIGAKDVEVISAQGTAIDPSSAFQTALNQIQSVAAR